MKIEDLKKYSFSPYSLPHEVLYCTLLDVENLYNHQQSIIDSLVSNSESQAETNRVLANRLRADISWLKESRNQYSDKLNNYEDTDEEQFEYLQGILEGLEMAIYKLESPR